MCGMAGKAKMMPNEEDGVIFWVRSERDVNWTHGHGMEMKALMQGMQ